MSTMRIWSRLLSVSGKVRMVERRGSSTLVFAVINPAFADDAREICRNNGATLVCVEA
jgi:hypothetical protein